MRWFSYISLHFDRYRLVLTFLRCFCTWRHCHRKHLRTRRTGCGQRPTSSTPTITSRSASVKVGLDSLINVSDQCVDFVGHRAFSELPMWSQLISLDDFTTDFTVLFWTESKVYRVDLNFNCNQIELNLILWPTHVGISRQAIKDRSIQVIR